MYERGVSESIQFIAIYHLDRSTCSIPGPFSLAFFDLEHRMGEALPVVSDLNVTHASQSGNVRPG